MKIKTRLNKIENLVQEPISCPMLYIAVSQEDADKQTAEHDKICGRNCSKVIIIRAPREPD